MKSRVIKTLPNIFISIFLSITLLLTGCATTIQMTPAEKQEIKTIKVSNNVSVPKDMSYMGPGMTYGLMFGVVGALAVGGKETSDADKMKAYVLQKKIFIQKIVKEQMIKALKSGTHYKLVSKNPDATMYLTIKSYGFSIPHGFSTELMPVLEVQGKLIDKQNKIIWEDQDRVIPLPFDTQGMPLHTWQQLVKAPELIRQSWTKAAEKVSVSLAETLE